MAVLLGQVAVHILTNLQLREYIYSFVRLFSIHCVLRVLLRKHSARENLSNLPDVPRGHKWRNAVINPPDATLVCIHQS